MKELKTIFLIFSLTLSILMGCSAAKPADDQPKKQASKADIFIETANTHILQTVDRNISGDRTKENIILYVNRTKDGMPQSWSLVVNGIEKIKLSHEGGLYSFAEMNFVDIDGDKKEEVLLYRQSSGSAGAKGLNVYKPTEAKWQQVFSNVITTDMGQERFQVKYMGDYFVRFEDKETGLKAVIELNKKQYQGIENMLKNISTWIDPIIDYSLVDHDGDGTKEIITLQRVIGISHADTIALLKTTYKMEQGQYKLISLTLCDYNDKPLAEAKL
ncbi:hypothetical protein [Desulforamulus reducens]|nr:hypothetical protein [Desulforamulus reducens]